MYLIIVIHDLAASTLDFCHMFHVGLQLALSKKLKLVQCAAACFYMAVLSSRSCDIHAPWSTLADYCFLVGVTGVDSDL